MNENWSSSRETEYFRMKQSSVTVCADGTFRARGMMNWFNRMSVIRLEGFEAHAHVIAICPRRALGCRSVCPPFIPFADRCGTSGNVVDMA